MDSDRVEGLVNQLGGKMRQVYGEVADDAGARAEGRADQVSGRVQNAYGSAKDSLRDGAGSMEAQLASFVKERPLVALLAAAGLGYVYSRMTRGTRGR